MNIPYVPNNKHSNRLKSTVISNHLQYINWIWYTLDNWNYSFEGPPKFFLSKNLLATNPSTNLDYRCRVCCSFKTMFLRQITLRIVDYHFSSWPTATLHLCLLYFKITWTLSTLVEHMHKKSEINRTKIKGRKVVTHDSNSDLPLGVERSWDINIYIRSLVVLVNIYNPYI